MVDDDYIRVSAAKKRFLGGTMSIRWWYKQVESGRLQHFRAGAVVLLRPADVEAFVAEMYRERSALEAPPDPLTLPATTGKKSRGGLRFFG